jgi:hypothetical protein
LQNSSLKLDETLYQETEELIGKLKKSTNRYINEALYYYNRIQKKKILEKLLEEESKMVSDESMKILSEFENLADYDS